MGETELRWQLRQLPHELEPPRDLWPGIAAGLDRRAPRRRWPWVTGLAMAAGLVLAVAVGTGLRPAPVPAAADPTALLVQREAQALVQEYEAALREFDGAPVPEPLAPALATLDASAEQIRAALAEDPGRPQLLDHLRRTYARRLSLTQRALVG